MTRFSLTEGSPSSKMVFLAATGRGSRQQDKDSKEKRRWLTKFMRTSSPGLQETNQYPVLKVGGRNSTASRTREPSPQNIRANSIAWYSWRKTATHKR